MQMSGQLQTPTVYPPPPRERTPVSTEQEAGWALEPVRIVLKKTLVLLPEFEPGPSSL